MHKLLTTFLLVFVGCSILSAIMAGGGGVVSTVLAEDVSANATFIPATNTTSFAPQDIIEVDDEQMIYTSKNTTGFFVPAEYRGYLSSSPAEHEAGARIYTAETSVLNSALGFNIMVQVQTGGTFGIITLPINFFTQTLPHLVMLNVNFLQSPSLQYIAIFWFAAGIALLVTLAIEIAPIAVSLITGFLGLVRR